MDGNNGQPLCSFATVRISSTMMQRGISRFPAGYHFARSPPFPEWFCRWTSRRSAGPISDFLADALAGRNSFAPAGPMHSTIYRTRAGRFVGSAFVMHITMGASFRLIRNLSGCSGSSLDRAGLVRHSLALPGRGHRRPAIGLDGGDRVLPAHEDIRLLSVSRRVPLLDPGPVGTATWSPWRGLASSSRIRRAAAFAMQPGDTTCLHPRSPDPAGGLSPIADLLEGEFRRPMSG